MDGQQPGNIYTPGQPEDGQSEATGTGTPDEIAQIDSAVQSNLTEKADQKDYNEPASPEPESGAYVGEAAGQQTRSLSGQNSQAQTPVTSVEGSFTPETSVTQDTVDIPGSNETPTLLLSWQSSGDMSDRGPKWYAAIFAVTATFAGLTLLGTGSWMSAIVVVMAASAVVIVNTKGPQVQAYGIFDAGVQIEERFYGYEQLRSFSLSNLNGETLIELEPSKRFYPRITMHAGDFMDQAQELLGQFLPKNNREPDMIDKISQHLKL